MNAPTCGAEARALRERLGLTVEQAAVMAYQRKLAAVEEAQRAVDDALVSLEAASKRARLAEEEEAGAASEVDSARRALANAKREAGL